MSNAKSARQIADGLVRYWEEVDRKLNEERVAELVERIQELEIENTALKAEIAKRDEDGQHYLWEKDMLE